MAYSRRRLRRRRSWRELAEENFLIPATGDLELVIKYKEARFTSRPGESTLSLTLELLLAAGIQRGDRESLYLIRGFIRFASTCAN